MKSDVEKLSETRVKFDVEIPFEELADEIAAAYKKIGNQVQIPGFRKGRVPRQIIDQRIGRGAVLEEVINARVPQAYDEVVQESGLYPLGQPNLEITEIADGEKITFVAETDIRPEFDLPDYAGIEIEVDALEVSEDDVSEELDSLRARFGSYKPVERAAESGDVLLIDLKAVAGDEEIEELAEQALSYEVGEEGLLPGLDEAVIGLSEGEEATFGFTPEFGDQAGTEIQVTVSVKAVRERELPEVNDELAMLASEFDTVEELIADIKERLGRRRLMERGQQARNRIHDALLELIDIPVPDGIIEAELAEHFGDGHGDDDHRAETELEARKNLKGQFIFDRIADEEEISVGEAELSQWLMMQAPQYGMSAEQFAEALVEAGQVPTAIAEIRRGKALGAVLEKATIVDTNGDAVDLKEIDRELRERAGVADEDIEAEEAEELIEAEATEAAESETPDEATDEKETSAAASGDDESASSEDEAVSGEEEAASEDKS